MSAVGLGVQSPLCFCTEVLGGQKFQKWTFLNFNVELLQKPYKHTHMLPNTYKLAKKNALLMV